jgi:hypothetical protein
VEISKLYSLDMLYNKDLRKIYSGFGTLSYSDGTGNRSRWWRRQRNSDLRQVASVLTIPLVAIADKITDKVELTTSHFGASKTLLGGLGWRQRQKAVTDFWDRIGGGFSGNCMDTSWHASSQSRRENNYKFCP